MILLTMIFLHIVDDYYLQGILAKMKVRNYWKRHYPDRTYKYDYIWALLMHAFSWTFMVMLPIAYLMNFNITGLFAIAFLLNVLIHAFVDNLKANKQKINLIQDQSIHLLQIILTFAILL
jgi:hypothetical protein